VSSDRQVAARQGRVPSGRAGCLGRLGGRVQLEDEPRALDLHLRVDPAAQTAALAPTLGRGALGAGVVTAGAAAHQAVAQV